MGIIIASILTFFLNKREESKILAILLIAYVLFINSLTYFKWASFTDYVHLYSISTTILCISLFVYTKRDWKQFLLVFLTVVPQVYYLLVLYKPYLLCTYIPFWWLVSVDKLFTYSVFLLCYEQGMDFNFKLEGMTFKEVILNIAITLFLILF